MRDDHKLALKKLKQKINAFVLRHGHQYTGTKWTIKHVTWLRNAELDPMYRETINENMASYEEQEKKIEHKSKKLRSRQSGQSAEVIAYADKANTQLRSKYYKMIRHGKKKNVAVVDVARELVCFVWV